MKEFVLPALINVLACTLILATGRLRSTWFGDELLMLALWISSGTAIACQKWNRRLIPLISIGLVAMYLTLFVFLMVPLFPWKNNEKNETQFARALLRIISSEQEQFRIVNARYAKSPSELFGSRWTPVFDSLVRFDNSNAIQWGATVSVGPATCEWGRQRDSGADNVSEGGAEPTCFLSNRGSASFSASLPNLLIFSREWPDSARKASSPIRFAQHRFDAMHMAVMPGPKEDYHWQSKIGSELRASASAASERVFVGAHGSGELSAIDLRTGTEKWSVRVPNWIHHEPVITGDVLVVGFGDSRPSATLPTLSRIISLKWSHLGSFPSGVEAYDTVHGALMWRQFTSTSVMASPVLFKDLVIAREASGVIHAWDVVTGKLRWRTILPNPSFGLMTNPVEYQENLFVLSDPGSWCLIRAISGEVVRCRSVSRVLYGPGHATPAVMDSLLVYVGFPASFQQDVARLPVIKNFVSRNYSSAFVEATTWRTGKVAWRTLIDGTASPAEPGHIAGTPVIVQNRIIIPIPTIGEVVALDLATGKVSWREKVFPARGSVSVINNKVIVLTRQPSVAVLDLLSGSRACE